MYALRKHTYSSSALSVVSQIAFAFDAMIGKIARPLDYRNFRAGSEIF